MGREAVSGGRSREFEAGKGGMWGDHRTREVRIRRWRDPGQSGGRGDGRPRMEGTLPVWGGKLRQTVSGR